MRAARVAAGLSREQLGVAAGLSGVTVGRLERGQHVPRADTLSKLAAALDVPVSRLLGETEAVA